MTSITIPSDKRVAIGLYCIRHISPSRYYLHNAVGGVGWRIVQRLDGYALECSDEHLILIRLKYGV